MNQLAKHIVDMATGEVEDEAPEKHENAAERGRKGGRARADSLEVQKRSDIAKRAARARWRESAPCGAAEPT